MNAITTTEQHAIVPQQDSSAVMTLIGRMASDPSVDVTKLQQLMDMHERMSAKQAESAFNAAMSAAQAEMGRVSADATNPQTRSRYATYAAIDRALRPIYTRHGFSLSFDTSRPAPDGFVMVTAFVAHTAGHTREYGAPMPADGKGAKGNDVMTKTHAFGAAVSYGMRYLLKQIFNVAIGEDDNDGNVSDDGFRLADWLAKAEEAANLDELRDTKDRGFAVIRKRNDTASYREFKAAVEKRLAVLNRGA